MVVVELRVPVLSAPMASVVLREAIADQPLITAWHRCARWALASVTRSKSISKGLA